MTTVTRADRAEASMTINHERRARMGAHTDMQIRTWQQQAGITPATGDRRLILDAIAHEAAMLIEVVTLEKSGIRDGAGFWYGSDDLEHTARRLNALMASYVPSPAFVSELDPDPEDSAFEPF
jgi:hypothetical protein